MICKQFSYNIPEKYMQTYKILLTDHKLSLETLYADNSIRLYIHYRILNYCGLY